ncbi:hypothetical protein TYRP_013861 [Tyrophagus putrescentiae]|nr:hypothetical protein TYRP_013861 [Tyrophagus putrescentiae]
MLMNSASLTRPFASVVFGETVAAAAGRELWNRHCLLSFFPPFGLPAFFCRLEQVSEHGSGHVWRKHMSSLSLPESESDSLTNTLVSSWFSSSSIMAVMSRPIVAPIRSFAFWKVALSFSWTTLMHIEVRARPKSR